MIYKILYQVGFTPWEGSAEQPRAREQISAMFDREENERRPPSGSALDLGCGGGLWSIELARRGWQVTGVDIVPKALRTARPSRINLYCSQSLTIRMYQLPIDMIPRIASVPIATQSP